MTTSVGSIKLDLSIDGSDAWQQVASEVNKAMGPVLSEVNKLNAEVANASKGAASSVSQAGESARKAASEYNNLTGVQAKAADATQKVARANSTAASEVGKAGSAASKAGSDYSKLTDEQKKAAAAGERVGTTIGKSIVGFKNAGDAALGAVGKIAKFTGIAGAVTGAVGGLAGGFNVLRLGMNRLNNIEQAEAKLRGLGRTTEETKSIMDSVTASVKGTAFGMDEAANSAAVFSTMGVRTGDDMTRTMKLLSDATAQANSSFGEMTPIFQKV
ncbi:MAG: hypothetical protein WDA30_23170, partial [Mycolicibacterium sp.]